MLSENHFDFFALLLPSHSKHLFSLCLKVWNQTFYYSQSQFSFLILQFSASCHHSLITTIFNHAFLKLWEFKGNCGSSFFNKTDAFGKCKLGLYFFFVPVETKARAHSQLHTIHKRLKWCLPSWLAMTHYCTWTQQASCDTHWYHISDYISLLLLAN